MVDNKVAKRFVKRSKMIKCDICGKELKSEKGLAPHLRLAHGMKLAPDTRDTPAKQSDVDRVLNANRNLLAAYYKLVDENNRLKDELMVSKIVHPKPLW